LLAVAPVYAAPSLRLGSTASYNLTGKLQVDQSCTADQLAYASQACLGYSTVTVSNAYVTIFDDGHCSPGGDPACYFSPSYVSVSQGSFVSWYVSGMLRHDVKSNATANIGLPTFFGNLTQGGSFSVTFVQTGTYHYYDANYTWMKGTILVTPPPPPPPPPTPTSYQVLLSGTVGWNVEGLSTDQANLNVSHQIGVSVPPITFFTPVTESGSFEQSINLSTRVESPGTAASIVKSLLTLLPAMSGYFGSTAVSTPVVSTPVVSAPVSQMILSAQSTSPIYSAWWVNGPLSNGSPVQIVQGWSSVTGSESLNLGGTIGTRSAWIVTSQLSQTVNVNIPNPNNLFNPSTSKATASLKLLWSFDKTADLLLRNENTVSLTVHSVTPTTIYTPTICGQYSCYNPITVTVTRDMALTVSLALLLSSTNLKLTGPASQTPTLMGVLSSLPWMPLGIAGLAAGIAVALILWFTRRAKQATLPVPSPVTPPAQSPATPS